MIRLAKAAAYLLGIVLVLTEIALAVTMFVASHTGHTFLIITGGSMEPTYHLGSALILKDLSNDEIVDGTVVTYQSVEGVLTTHRVIGLHQINGTTYLQTQGDANEDPDPNFTDIDSVIGTPVVNIPNGGYVATFMLSPWGRWLIFGPPLIMLLFVELRLIRARLRKHDGDNSSHTTDSTSRVSIRVSDSTSIEGAPSQPKSKQTWSTVTICIVVLAAAALSGVTYAHSSAVFADSETLGGNAVSAAVLQPPTGVTAAAATRQANLSWTASPSLFTTGYTIYRGSTTGGPYAPVGAVTGRHTVTYSDFGAEGPVRYVVQSEASEWNSLNSNEGAATVTRTPVLTPYYNCSVSAADTGGDNNGFQSSPLNACSAQNSSNATDTNSGNAASTTCASTSNDRHRFSGWASPVPANALISGIEVRHIGRHNRNGNSAGVCVQVSGDGGTTWTATQSNTYTSTGFQTFTFGGAADLWGTQWTPSMLSSTNFVVRVINVSAATNRTFSLDSLQVRVTYR